MFILVVFLFSAVTAIDLLLAYNSGFKRGKSSFWLSMTFLTASVTSVSYLCSMWFKNYFIMSLMSSIYFLSIDGLLNCLIAYILFFTNRKVDGKSHLIHRILACYMVADAVFLFINPFNEITMSYHYIENSLAHWRYIPHALYQVHLVYCYILILFAALYLLRKIISLPLIYLSKYLNILLAMLSVVMMNAVFLFIPDNTLIDFSILFYSVMGFILYWNAYHYVEKGMLAKAREVMMNEIGHPLVLFDNEDRLAMFNEDAGQIFNMTIAGKAEYYFSDMVKEMGIEDRPFGNEKESFLWDAHNLERSTVFRCDYNPILDSRGRLISKLFMFTDNTIDVDVMTGFYTRSNFLKNYEEYAKRVQYPLGIGVCDINNLSSINTRFGNASGDKAISTLAEIMKRHCPEDSYFVRLNDGNLSVLCPGKGVRQMRDIFDAIHADFSQVQFNDEHLDVQSSVYIVTSNLENLRAAVRGTIDALKSRKMLDSSSSHASLLLSLAQTQMESDNETEAHVQRTRLMGEKLGRRLGLTDSQLSNLSLLCLLHDIGKVGIPLEILNKPGRLSDAEWELMKSHVEKGYRIAMASKELTPIAECILHHHECWNGTGYPDRLSYESIPLLSRIIAVVDTFDAMTNDRPYRKGVGLTAAKAELKRCAGTQFDPYVVSEFLDLLEELYPETENEADVAEVISVKPRIQERDIIDDNSNISFVSYSKYTVGDELKILKVDDAFSILTGYSKEDVKEFKLTQFDLIPYADRSAYKTLIKKHIESSDDNAYFEHRILRKDGTERYVLCFGRDYYDSAAKQRRTELVVTDISSTHSLREMENRIKLSESRRSVMIAESARRDALTGLLNREAYRSDVQMRILNSTEKAVFIMMDVDYFKTYNDTKGHLEGDRLLIFVSDALEFSAGSECIVGRMGGDEFSIFVPFQITTPDEVCIARATSIYEAMAAKMRTTESEVTISMGATITSNTDETFEEVYAKADKALYSTKEKGRNGISFN